MNGLPAADTVALTPFGPSFVQPHPSEDRQSAGQDEGDEGVDRCVAVVEHRPLVVHLPGVDAEEAEEQTQGSGDRGDEGDCHDRPDTTPVASSLLGTLDRGEFGGDGVAEPAQHLADRAGASGQTHRGVEGVVEALHA
ncbi:hypothetical protein [Streptomyces sp. M41(2017)]|uniref:hypothetical protein n=1 Tax=Streptomyces sp. M41(2017) TaxID=1955065 RepID=UPI0015C475F0|nr:hypothetical protein [Streptomyces sp. M41(2017)]